MPDTHALLSASGAHRWLNCTPSAVAESTMPDTTSSAAAEGTVAHALAEYKLLTAMNREPETRPVSHWIDPDMEAYTDDYVAFVLEQRRQLPGPGVIAVEQRLDFSHIVPGGFGTGDCILIGGSTIHIIDLKYGKGVEVSAERNPQLMLYGLGALAAFDMLYDINTVKVSIFQPRRDHVDTWEIPASVLLEWADQVAKPLAETAAKGEGIRVAGDWCRFCRVKATCRARAEANLEAARHEFTPIGDLTVEEISEILAKASEVKAWLADVESWALAEVLDRHGRIPGFKLVEGRSIRRYTDEDEVAKRLRAKKYKVSEIYQPRRLLGITAMEKTLSKPVFNELLAGLIEKPPGKPTLVPVTDRRPELSTNPADDFTPVTTDGQEAQKEGN